MRDVVLEGGVDFALSRFTDDAALALAGESRAFYLAKLAAGGQRGPTSLEELTQARARASALARVGRGVEHLARAGERKVPVRVTAPSAGESRALYLDIHAGGFFMGSAMDSEARHARLADVLGMTVVSVEYRLAPENPWPAAPEDCESAALWILEEGRDLFGCDRLVIGGESAGATLAATTLLRLRDRGCIASVDGAVLFYGAYDLSGLTPGGRLYRDEWFIQAYVGHVSDRTNPDVSPLYGDLHDFPPTFVGVGTRDVLLEDNLAMASRLSAAGNEVEVRVYPEAMHGFMSHPTAMAAVAVADAEGWIVERAGRLVPERTTLEPGDGEMRLPPYDAAMDQRELSLDE
jgi:acetyl esterase